MKHIHCLLQICFSKSHEYIYALLCNQGNNSNLMLTIARVASLLLSYSRSKLYQSGTMPISHHLICIYVFYMVKHIWNFFFSINRSLLILGVVSCCSVLFLILLKKDWINTANMSEIENIPWGNSI